MSKKHSSRPSLKEGDPVRVIAGRFRGRRGRVVNVHRGMVIFMDQYNAAATVPASHLRKGRRKT